MIRLPIVKISPKLIKNPKKKFRSSDNVSDLQDDIRRNGQKEAIDVAFDAKQPKYFILIQGARRLKACKNLKRDVAARIVIPETEQGRVMLFD